MPRCRLITRNRRENACCSTVRLELRRPKPTANTSGKVLLFATCYGNRNMPSLAEDLVTIYRHNGIALALAGKESCCGMPKLELGDLDAVSRARDANIAQLAEWVDRGWDIVTPIPSCTLMFKQELPLMFPDDPQVAKVRDAMFDPFEYLMLRHRDGKMRTDFSTSLGKVAYQVPCHLRVQNIGLKTRDVLQLVPDTEVEVIERCSGHDGTYAVKKEFHEISKKIARPVIGRVKKVAPGILSAIARWPRSKLLRVWTTTTRSTRWDCCVAPTESEHG